MAVPDEDVVREVLAKHDRDIRCRQAVQDAWGAVRRDYPNPCMVSAVSPQSVHWSGNTRCKWRQTFWATIRA